MFGLLILAVLSLCFGNNRENTMNNDYVLVNTLAVSRVYCILMNEGFEICWT